MSSPIAMNPADTTTSKRKRMVPIVVTLAPWILNPSDSGIFYVHFGVIDVTSDLLNDLNRMSSG